MTVTPTLRISIAAAVLAGSISLAQAPQGNLWPDVTTESVRVALLGDLDRLVRALGEDPRATVCSSTLRFARLGDSRGGPGDWWMTCYGCIAAPVQRVIPWPRSRDLVAEIEALERSGAPTTAVALMGLATECE